MYYYESKGQWETHILATGWRGRQREERPSPERRHISYFFFVEKTCSIMKRNQNKKGDLIMKKVIILAVIGLSLVLSIGTHTWLTVRNSFGALQIVIEDKFFNEESTSTKDLYEMGLVSKEFYEESEYNSQKNR